MDRRPGPEDATTSRLSFGRVDDAISSSPASAPKVSQIDAHELDQGLVHMLAERLERAIGNIPISSSVDLKPELSLVLRLVLFKLSYAGSSTSSPGSRLVNLKLVHGPSGGRVPRRLLFLLLLLHPPIFPSYILSRLRRHALSQQWPDLPPHDWRKKAWRAIVRLENASRAYELLGWGWFLWDGQYPSLLMRLLKLRLVPSSPRVTRLVSYEFMNRQLVWSAFTEFLMFAIPIIPSIPTSLLPSTYLQPLKSLLRQPINIDYASLPLIPSHSAALAGSSSTSRRAAHSGPFASLPLNICPICHARSESVPVPIDEMGAGSGISLPPIHLPGAGVHSGMGQGGHNDREEEEGIFVPAQTDCWGGCRWCYYCIGEELYKFEEQRKEKASGKRRAGGKGKTVTGKEKGKHDEEVEHVERWSCLRCDGDVSRAWRVGGED